MTRRQIQLSVNLRRTNDFVISWLNPFRTVNSIRKHDIQNFSVLLQSKNKCQSIGNLSLFLLGESLIFKQLCMLGRGVSVYSMWATHFQPDALLRMPLSGSPCHGATIALWVSKRGRNGVETSCHLLLCSVRIFWSVSRLLIAINYHLFIDIKGNQTFEIFMSQASCGFYAFFSKAARLRKARWHSEIHCRKSRAFHQSHGAEWAESGPPTQDTVLLGTSICLQLGAGTGKALKSPWSLGNSFCFCTDKRQRRPNQHRVCEHWEKSDERQ